MKQVKQWLRKIAKKLFGKGNDLELMEYFLELMETIKQSLSCLSVLLEQYEDRNKREECFFRIINCEKKGDTIRLQILKKLNEISITSWITHSTVSDLVNAMDHILNRSRGVVKILKHYKLEEINTEMILLGEVIVKSGDALNSMMQLFCKQNWHKYHEKIMGHYFEISEQERQGDELKDIGLERLLNSDEEDQLLTRKAFVILQGALRLIMELEAATDDLNHVGKLIHQSLN